MSERREGASFIRNLKYTKAIKALPLLDVSHTQGALASEEHMLPIRSHNLYLRLYVIRYWLTWGGLTEGLGF